MSRLPPDDYNYPNSVVQDLNDKLAEKDAEIERLKAEARLHDTIVTQLQRGQKAQLESLESKLAQQEAAAEKLCAALEFYNQAGTKIWNEDECGERAHRAIAAYREAVKKGET